jgi:AAA domain/Bifunctional DNA primase/polymerase, N-terminal
VDPTPRGDAVSADDRMTCAEALAVAQLWASRNVPAFPIAIGWDDQKQSTNKRPLTDHGHRDATTDPAELERLFNARSPKPGEVWGVGLWPGPAGYAVVDVDVKGGIGGDDTWAALRSEHGDVTTYTVTTATTGLHLWGGKGERHVGNAHDLGPGIDVRGDEGWVVAPGTRTPWGSWDREDSSPRWPPAPWPAWALERLNAANGQRPAAGRWRPLDRDQLDPLTRETLEVMEQRHGAHSAILGPEGEVRLTRPGKRAGTSATIGYVGPGVVKMHSSSWPPFVLGQRYTLDELLDDTIPPPNGDTDRRLALTPAADLKPRRVRWLWDGRLALGTLGLLAGPEGLGKSTIAYWVAARITRGELPGEHFGHPRGVLVCATEDSWEHTIVPRLMAAGADLTRVFRVEIMILDDITVGLSLPADLPAIERAAVDVDVALLILDPLMSRLHESLDTHRDGDVRRALEPLVSVADNTGMAILGLIHHNKSGSTDPLQLVMASKAFTAVARSVHTAIKDPDDETGNRRLFGTPKNNLGRIDLPTLSFTIIGWYFDTDDGPGETGQLVWGDDVEGTIAEAMVRAGRDPDERSAVDEAADWLDDYMQAYGPKVASADAKAEGKKVGHADHNLKRARSKLKLRVVSEGFPRVTYWVDERPVGTNSPRGDTSVPTELTRAEKAQVNASWNSRNSGNDTGGSEFPLPPLSAALDHRCTDCGDPATDISGLCDQCYARRLNPGELGPIGPETLF